MFIQGDKKNEFLPILDWQSKLMNIRPNFYFTDIHIDRIYSDRGQTIVKYNNFTYVLYYKYGDHQGYDIPILLNLNTGKSRCIYGSNDINIKHNGARIDYKLAKLISDKFEIPDLIV
jgi:hypothetical protein